MLKMDQTLVFEKSAFQTKEGKKMMAYVSSIEINR